jgi:monoamine oxidase
MTAFSTIIIGAGAAGLAAGRLLHDAGGSILILEARNRLGGRIWTDHDFADFPIELGAEFIHGDQAVTHNLVRQAGLSIMPAPRLANLWWSEGQRPAVHRDQLPPLIRDMLNGLLKDYEALAEIPSPLPTRGDTPIDLSLADYLRARGWDADALEMADVILAQTCCANLDSLSCYDLIREIRADHAGHQDSRIRESYAPLLQWYSRDLPIRFNTAVTRIQWGADGVTITAGNEIFRADKCILTIPVSLLQRGMVQFNPPLSAAKQAAVAAFRTQAATKLIYHFQEPLWHESLVYMAHTGLAARWWTPGYGRPDAGARSGRTEPVTWHSSNQFTRQVPECEACFMGGRPLGAWRLRPCTPRLRRCSSRTGGIRRRRIVLRR